jgi:hypothetical protein
MTKEQARNEAALQAREEAALAELEEIGFRVSLYEPRTYVEEDVLLGVAGGWKLGTCYAVADSVDGKRKTFSGMSAVQALADAKGWLRYQETRLSPELRFQIVKGENVAAPVIQRVAGDAAETAARRGNERRIISFESGTAELVNQHGAPMGDDNQAAQFATAETKGPRS